jgi:hypothetical protein
MLPLSETRQLHSWLTSLRLVYANYYRHLVLILHVVLGRVIPRSKVLDLFATGRDPTVNNRYKGPLNKCRYALNADGRV